MDRIDDEAYIRKMKYLSWLRTNLYYISPSMTYLCHVDDELRRPTIHKEQKHHTQQRIKPLKFRIISV